jgi:tripartite-type tricarboxylate transporter receptor subunit TctC
MLKTSKHLIQSCLLAAAVGVAGSAAAQSFPSRPLTIVVPYAAGATDRQARQIAEIASRELGQSIVVENRDGAGGTIGAQYVASSKPDGHTILYGAPAVITVAPLTGAAQYKYDALKALARVNIIPHMVAARADAPFKTIPELVAYAKANPGKVTFGSPGSGTAVHLAGEAFADAAGIQLNHVPFRGVAPAVTAASGGFVDLVFGAPGAINPQIQGGRLIPLAQLGASRTNELSSIPTVREQGVDLALSADFGLFVAKDTPPDVVAKLESAVKVAVESEDFRKSVTAALSSPAYLNSDDYQKLVDQERDIYSRIVPKLSLGAK